MFKHEEVDDILISYLLRLHDNNNHIKLLAGDRYGYSSCILHLEVVLQLRSV